MLIFKNIRVKFVNNISFCYILFCVYEEIIWCRLNCKDLLYVMLFEDLVVLELLNNEGRIIDKVVYVCIVGCIKFD